MRVSVGHTRGGVGGAPWPVYKSAPCPSRIGIGPLLAVVLVAFVGGCGGSEKPKAKSPASQATEPPKTAKTYEKQTTGATFDVPASEPPAKEGAKAPPAEEASKEAPAKPAGQAVRDPARDTAQAEDYLHQGRYEDAVRECRLALSKNERFVPAMVVMAKAYYHLGRPGQAQFVLFTRVLDPMKKGELQVEPADLAEIYNILGMIDLKKGLKETALKYFRDATEKDPRHAAAWNNLAALLVVQKDYQSALQAAEKAVELAPQLPKTHLNLGSAYRGTKQYEKALAAYKKALSLKPNYPEALFNIGVLYLDADSYPGMTTIQRLEAAIQYFMQYKIQARAQGVLSKDDLVEEYLKRAEADLANEKKQEERRRKRAEKEAARKKAKAAEEGGEAKPGEQGSGPAKGEAPK